MIPIVAYALLIWVVSDGIASCLELVAQPFFGSFDHVEVSYGNLIHGMHGTCNRKLFTHLGPLPSEDPFDRKFEFSTKLDLLPAGDVHSPALW